MTGFERGDVVWGPDPFKVIDNPRPWLIINNGAHPFDHEEYIVVALTTTEREATLLVDEHWVTGRPDRRSYASPWTISTLKHDAVVDPQGSVTEAFVQRVVRRLNRYLAAPDAS